MKRLLAALIGAAGLVLAPIGSTHLAYCGHADRAYSGGFSKADYRYYANAGGDHFHYYRHLNLAPNGTWLVRHTYSRTCNEWV